MAFPVQVAAAGLSHPLSSFNWSKEKAVRDQLVNVHIRCRCGQTFPGCVNVEQQVPKNLQCTPSGGGGGGGGDRRIRCPSGRHHVCFESIEDLEKATKEVMRARGWGRFMKDGFVPALCDG